MADILRDIARLFYIVNPWETMYEDLDDVPYFIGLTIPYFLICIAAEAIIISVRHWWSTDKAHIKNKPYRLNHAIASVSSGLVMMSFDVIAPRQLEIPMYIYLYRYYSLANLPVNIWTWLLAFFLADLGWYVFHVAAHKVNLFWASHVVVTYHVCPVVVCRQY